MIFNLYVWLMATGWSLATAAAVLFLAMFGQSISRRDSRILKSPLARIDKKVRTAAIVAFGVEFLAVWFIIWFFNPAMVGLFSGVKILLLVSCFAVVIGGWLSGTRVAVQGLQLLTILLVWPTTEFVVTEIRHHSDFAGLANITVMEKDQKLPETNMVHLPIVTSRIAQKRISLDRNLAAGRIASGQITIDVAAWHMQPVGNDKHLWLIAPAPYDSCFSQKASPGFVAVDGENPGGKMLWFDTPIKYAPSGCFANNLNRHLYLNGYTSGYLLDARFVVDNNWHPYYVVTWAKPAYGPIHYGVLGYKIDRTLIVDAQSGAILKPSDVKFATNVVMDDTVVKDYIADFAGKQNAKLADNQPQMQYNAGNEPTFIASMLSSKNDEKLTVGVVQYDTNKASGKFYPALSGIVVGDAVASAFKNSPSNDKHWDVIDIRLITFHGISTYVGIYEAAQSKEMSWYAGIGFLEAHHSNPDDVQMDTDEKGALSKYQEFLASESTAGRVPGQGGPDQTVTGLIYRVGTPALINNNQLLEIKLTTDPRTFRVRTNFVGATMARDGDPVTLKFYSTSNEVILVSSFEDEALSAKAAAAVTRK